MDEVMPKEIGESREMEKGTCYCDYFYHDTIFTEIILGIYLERPPTTSHFGEEILDIRAKLQ